MPSAKSARAQQTRWAQAQKRRARTHQWEEQFPILERRNVTTDGHLCQRCRRIDLSGICALTGFALEDAENAAPTIAAMAVGRLVFELGEVELSLRSTCSLCRIFAGMARASQPISALSPDSGGEATNSDAERAPRTFHLRAFARQHFWHLARNTEIDPRDGAVVIVLAEDASSPGGSKTGLSRNRLRHREEKWRARLLERGVIQPLADPVFATEEGGESQGSQELPLEGWPVPPWFPATRVRGMINACLNSHERCAPATRHFHFPDRATVIDCRTQTRRSLTSRMDYLALSYVYGQKYERSATQRPDLIPMPRNLPRDLPQVVRDAMAVTRELGFRYLWVDAYCINFHDKTEYERQLSEMANIYSYATATICALGPNDTEPIPGVSKPRTVRFKTRAQDATYGWVGRELRTIVRESHWHTRAWTLQELVLSQRCLFFTDDEVVMVCGTGVFNENVPLDKTLSYQGDNSYDREDFLLEDGSRTGGELSASKRFEMLRKHYQKRQLRKPEDALHAFQAILAQLTALSYWGIVAFDQRATRQETPKLPITELAFIDGLSWTINHPDSKTNRNNPELPSWSWITQTRPITNVVDRTGSTSERSQWHALVHIEMYHDVYVKLASHLNEHCSYPIVPSPSKYLQIHTVSAQWQSVPRSNERNTIRAHITRTSNHQWRPYLASTPGELLPDVHEKHLPMQGQAILLSIQSRPHAFSRWLVVSPDSAGVYTRLGLLIWPARAGNVNIEAMNPLPPSDAIQTFQLG